MTDQTKNIKCEICLVKPPTVVIEVESGHEFYVCTSCENVIRIVEREKLEVGEAQI